MSAEARPERPAKYSLLPPGKVVGSRYEIERVIGEGAQSVVYLASRRDAPGDKLALKVIHRHLSGTEQVKKRFHREAKILGSLEGEHVVKLLDFVEEDGLFMLALELVEGTSLEALLAPRAPLPLKQAIEITLQVCAALGAAHAAGIVHRDLKPANVLIETPNHGGHDPHEPISLPDGDLRVKVVDFGLAKVLHGGAQEGSTGLTEQGMIFGTPEYMAPEQARGDDADARSDIYAAGVMLYEMAVGAAPFSGRSPLAAMTAQLTETPPSPRAARGPSISPALDAVILRALAKDPADRYPTARAFAEAIASARDEHLVIAPVRVDNPAEVETGDTDLHLEHATTLRVDEIDELRKEAEASADAGAAPPPTFQDTRLRSDPAAPPDDLALEPELPPRLRWIWVTVALIAAAVGVVLGILFGTR